LELLAQLPVCISQGGYNVKIKVVIQKGALNNLLIGTDIQSALGFCLLKKESETCGLDLVSGKHISFISKSSNPMQCDTVVAKANGPEVEQSSTDEQTQPVELLQEHPESQLIRQQQSSGQTQQEKASDPVRKLTTRKEVGQPEQITGTVRLLNGVRIPARHEKIVRVKLSSPPRTSDI